MKLYGSLTSPYVRKARVLIAEKKTACRDGHRDPWPEDSRIPTRNPLGKVPVLEVEPGNTLFESVLVLHYLDHVDGKSITPKDAPVTGRASGGSRSQRHDRCGRCARARDPPSRRQANAGEARARGRRESSVRSPLPKAASEVDRF
jgi:glutathione S-transferase